MKLLCPVCQKLLTIADQFSGQQMKCPMCNGLFQAPALPAAGTNPPLAEPVQPQLQGSFAPAAAAVNNDVQLAEAGVKPGEKATVKPVVQEEDLGRSIPWGGLEQNPDLGPLLPPPSSLLGAADIISIPSSPSLNLTPIPPIVPPQPPLPGQGRVTFRINPEYVRWLAPLSLLAVFCLLFFPWIAIHTTPESYSAWAVAFMEPVSLLLIIFNFLVPLALLVAVATLGIDLKLIPTERLPPWTEPLVALRTQIVLVLCAFALVFLALQVFVVGFNIEIAAAKSRGENTTYFLMYRTMWLNLAVVAQVLAVAGAVLEGWLLRRGNHPVRVTVNWENIGA